MDLLERTADTINAIDELPIAAKLGYLGAEESLVIYPLAGSNTIQTYMTGDTEEEHKFEIAMKSKREEKISVTLWKITRALQQLKTIESSEGSFAFESLRIDNMPFINQAETGGWFVFLLDITIRITNYSGGE